MGSLFGGGDDGASKRAAELSRQQAASAQRRQLAELARSQAEVDQAKASSSGTRGRRMLTFLQQPALGDSGTGSGTFGGVS